MLTETTLKAIGLCRKVLRAFLKVMSREPLSYFAVKFPAPVCDDCALPMITVTTVFHQAKSQAVKVVSYQCQKCKGTLGWPRQRRGPKHFRPHFRTPSIKRSAHSPSRGSLTVCALSSLRRQAANVREPG